MGLADVVDREALKRYCGRGHLHFVTLAVIVGGLFWGRFVRGMFFLRSWGKFGTIFG